MHRVHRPGVLSFAVAITIAIALGPGTASAQSSRHDPSKFSRKTTETVVEAVRWDDRHVWTFLKWSPRQCDGDPRSGNPSLVTRVAGYAGSDLEPWGISEFTHDRHGNVVSKRGLQRTAPGTYGTVVVFDCVYDAGAGELNKGKLVYMTERHSVFGNGPVYRATYNSRGQHETETEDFDWGNNGTFDLRWIVRYVYDDDTGLLVEQLREGDLGADGSIEGASGARAAWDAQGRLTRLVEGYYETPGGTFTPEWTLSNVFDDELRIAYSTQESDYDGDGRGDFVVKRVGYFDQHGLLVRHVSEDDYFGRPGGADGLVDSRTEITFEHDADGHVTRVFNDRTFERSSGFILWSEEWRGEYDARGRLVRTIASSDDFRDGTPEVIGTTTYTRDQRGLVLEALHVAWSRSTGTSSTREVFRYDGLGNLVEAGFGDPARGRTIWEHAAGVSGQAPLTSP